MSSCTWKNSKKAMYNVFNSSKMNTFSANLFMCIELKLVETGQLILIRWFFYHTSSTKKQRQQKQLFVNVFRQISMATLNIWFGSVRALNLVGTTTFTYCELWHSAKVYFNKHSHFSIISLNTAPELYRKYHCTVLHCTVHTLISILICMNIFIYRNLNWQIA